MGQKKCCTLRWLWFLAAVPLGAVVTTLILRRRRAMRSLAQRYYEPDSIPIDTRLPTPVVVAAAPQEPPAPPMPAAPDDLKKIEGIGPVISGILVSRGIVTFQMLADTPVEALDDILAMANLKRLSSPGTWPEQAAYAARGDWEGLAALQKTLKAGRRQS